MAVAVCPKPETLAAFARGDLSAAELAGVAEHLGGCEACCKALQFIPEDTLAGLARAAAQSPATANSVGQPSPLGSGTALTGGPPAFANHSRYRIISELGAGGMGTVYKAEDLLMGRIIALKVVSPHLTAKASAVERFRKEIRAAAQLKDHHIVTAHDAGEAGGSHFLVMEYVEGVSLDRLVAKKGPLPVSMACAFVRQAALGLQHAAEKGMTHRDIKPQNLMVTRKGQVKILDFGLARFASTDEENLSPTVKLPFGAGKAPANAGVTNPNLLMGTPDYLSPEQAKNSHDVDPRSDIYSLGCTLYFLLTGKPPFVSAGTLIDKLLAHTEEAPPPIREARFEVPEGLADVLAKMMAKKPADRYQTAKEAADALYPYTRTDAGAKEPVFEIVEAVAVAPKPLVATPVAAAAPAELAFDTDPQRGGPTLAEVAKPKKAKKSKKRQPWWQRRKWTLLGAAALFLIVAVAIAVLGNKKPTGNPKDGPANPPATAKGNPPPPGKGEKTNTNPGTPPTDITPGKSGVKVLYVVPSNGVWLHDYTDVRKQLESKGVTVVTASTDGGSSKPHPEMPGPPVPIDKFFTADSKALPLSEYSAVVFAGRDSEEYMTGKGSWAAKKVIEKMQEAGKPVAAICTGQGVLAVHGALRGKKAAHCQPLVNTYPEIATKAGVKDWNVPGVIVDRSESTKVVITASGGRESVQFANAILDVIGVK